MRRAGVVLGPLLGALLLLEAVLRGLTASGTFLGIPLLPLDPAAPLRAARLEELRSAYIVFDPELGWTVGPDRRSRNGLYASTATGARSLGPQDPPPGGLVDALSFGDSFTHGDDVPAQDTWQAILGRRHGRSVVNLGVPGYGVDQALLRYRRLRLERPARMVLIGLMADNIGRHLSRYRPFIAPQEPLFYAKPRFLLEAGRLTLLPQPFARLEDYLAADAAQKIRGLAAHDRWFDPRRYEAVPLDAWRTARVARSLADRRRAGGAPWSALYDDPAAVTLTETLVAEFARQAMDDGRRALVLFFPERSFAEVARAKRPHPAAPLLDRLARRGIPLLDLSPAIARALAASAHPEAEFLPHYSPALNAAVAEAVLPLLARTIHEAGPRLPHE